MLRALVAVEPNNGGMGNAVRTLQNHYKFDFELTFGHLRINAFNCCHSFHAVTKSHMVATHKATTASALTRECSLPSGIFDALSPLCMLRYRLVCQKKKYAPVL